MKKINLYFFVICLCFSLKGNSDWAEERLEKMSVDEKIGQLFIIPICPKRDQTHLEFLKEFIVAHHIGGVILKQANPKEQIACLKALHQVAPLPLLVTGDAEWGLGMRMEDTISFPKNLTLGAIEDRSLLYDLGEEIGRQCASVGIQLNFAPVVDVNTNPLNPTIGMRSFGEDPKEVSERAILLMKGMQATGLLTCAKHLPGHGDTKDDSHKMLPVVPHDKERLENVELYPFKQLVEAGVSAIMTGHLFVPAMDTLPSTFSKKIVEDLLQDEWGFQGLCITDALNMQAMTDNYSAEEIALFSFLAGHDLLLYGAHIDEKVDEILLDFVPRALKALKIAYEKNIITDERLDRSVLKILRAKEKLISNRDYDIHSPSSYALKKKLIENAVTLYRDPKGLIPLPDKHSGVKIEFIFENSETTSQDLETLAKEHPNLIIVLYTSPYAITHLPKDATILFAYEKSDESRKAIGNVILGNLKPKGKLPITLVCQE